MEILNPGSLWLLLSIPLLILLHLFAPKGKVLNVSSLQLWPKDMDQGGGEFRWREFYKDPNLYLQLLALLLLILALINPVLKVHAVPSRRLVLIFDTSASMKAMENGKRRIEIVREEAIRTLNQRKEGTAVLIRAGVEPEIVYSGGVQEKMGVVETVRALNADDGPGNLLEAVQMAYGQTEKGGEIVLLTDGSSPDTITVRRRYPDVRIVAVGQDDRNVSIASLMLSEDRRGVIALLKNHGEGSEGFDLEALLDGKSMGTQKISLGPREESPFYFPIPSPFWPENMTDPGLEGYTIEARINIEDALSADNKAWTVWNREDRSSILLVTSGNRLLEQALKANKDWEVAVMNPASYEAAAKKRADSFDVIFFDRYRPPAMTQNSQPLSKGIFMIAPPAEGDGKNAYKDGGMIADWNRGHPVMRFLEPSHIHISKTSVLNPPPWAEVLLRSDRPLIFADSDFYRRSIVMGFDPSDSDVPKSPDFPIFIMNSVHWLQGRERGEEVHAGEVYSTRVPTSFEKEVLWVLTPEGKRERVTASNGLLRYGNTSVAGTYRMIGEGKSGGFEKRFAVNIAPEESSIRPLAIPVGPGLSGRMREKGESDTALPLWKPLAMMALVTKITEWIMRKDSVLCQVYTTLRGKGDGFLHRHRA